MERRLRLQLTISVFLALAVLLGIILGVTYISRFSQLTQMSDAYLELILKNGGELPEKVSSYPSAEDAEDAMSQRYLVVRVNADDKVESADLEQVATVNRAFADSLARRAIASGTDRGALGNYRYMIKTSSDGTRTVAILDLGRQLADIRDAVAGQALVSACGALVVTILFALLSRKIVAPIVRTQESQRQFVIDAGHDLRTPVSIISADADVLAMDLGESEWIDDIKRQVSIMSELTESLIVLSRATAIDSRKGDPVDFSRVVSDEVASFRSRSMLEGHPIRVEVAEGIVVRGTSQYLTRMVGALLDNALKYSSDGGSIDVGLTRHFRQAELTVRNDAEGVDPSEVKRWFDRFYQADRSRTHEAGGYGIGLSMVKAVAISHGGHATATAADDGSSVTMIVTIPVTRSSEVK